MSTWKQRRRKRPAVTTIELDARGIAQRIVDSGQHLPGPNGEKLWGIMAGPGAPAGLPTEEEIQKHIDEIVEHE